MTKLILDGWIVEEGVEGRLFYYSNKPVIGDNDEFSADNCDDNVFDIQLPIHDYLSTNKPQRCRIIVELDK